MGVNNTIWFARIGNLTYPPTSPYLQLTSLYLPNYTALYSTGGLGRQSRLLKIIRNTFCLQNCSSEAFPCFAAPLCCSTAFTRPVKKCSNKTGLDTRACES